MCVIFSRKSEVLRYNLHKGVQFISTHNGNGLKKSLQHLYHPQITSCHMVVYPFTQLPCAGNNQFIISTPFAMSHERNNAVWSLLHLAPFPQRHSNGTSEGTMYSLYSTLLVTGLHLFIIARQIVGFFPALVVLHIIWSIDFCILVRDLF